MYQVKADDIKECCSAIERRKPLPPIYCYSGNEKRIMHVFQTITVINSTTGKNVDINLLLMV